MIEKVTKILIAIALIVFTTGSVFADGKTPPPSSKKKGNFKKGTFSKSNAWSNNGKAADTPPDPGGGGSGNPVPISNGLAFLIIGSVIYIIGRIRKEDESVGNMTK